MTFYVFYTIYILLNLNFMLVSLSKSLELLVVNYCIEKHEN